MGTGRRGYRILLTFFSFCADQGGGARGVYSFDRRRAGTALGSAFYEYASLIKYYWWC